MRSLLLHEDCEVFGEPTGGILVGADGSTVGVVGRPGPEVLDAARGSFAADAEVLVIPETLEHMMTLIPGRRPRRALLYRLAQPFAPVMVEDVGIASVDAVFLGSLPEELAPEVEGSYLAAYRSVAGEVVSVCGAASITETLWDVGIDTLDSHQRQGHARACFQALASHLARQGMEPVWGAYEDNEASLAMARSLGFAAVDELWVIETQGAIT
jgi:GNAT superfamily N-acetyltransferase